MIFDDFVYFFIKTHVVRGEAILISTHNIDFCEDLTDIIIQLSSNMHLISSSDNSDFIFLLLHKKACCGCSNHTACLYGELTKLSTSYHQISSLSVLLYDIISRLIPVGILRNLKNIFCPFLIKLKSLVLKGAPCRGTFNKMLSRRNKQNTRLN